MRVKIEPTAPKGKVQFGELLGLYTEPDHGQTSVVVRLDGYGLVLELFHPSAVTPATVEEKEAHCGRASTS